MGDVDDKTSALIAKLLSEDNAYADYCEQEYALQESDDSDYGVNGRKKKAKKGPRKAVRASGASKKALDDGTFATARRNADSPEDPAHGTECSRDTTADDAVVEDLTATGRRKRKDTGSVREKARPWSEDEEKLFLASLELHGRNWKACAAHIGSRDARSVASHAQKYFIKLCLKGERLPAKVAESGTGYTLSGKPLDPDSAAAKAYGFKSGMLESLQSLGGACLDGLKMDAAAGAADKENGGAGNAEGETIVSESRKCAAAINGARKVRGRAAARASPASTEPEAEPPAPTEYAKNRPRREVQGPKATLGHTTESLELVKCMDFVGPAGSGAPLAQPFQVSVQAQVLLLMDVHAHLSSSEVIGLLGGVWDPDKRRIDVVRAFPCRRALGTQSGTSVELDPTAEVETRALMEAENLTPVGWYHSHPIFAPKPSQKDNENQRNYQALFRCATSTLEPFLGAIVGPYDVQLPSPASCITWFVVRTRQGALVPFHVRVNQSARQGLPDEAEVRELRGLMDMVKDDVMRINFLEPWRPFTHIVDGQAQGAALSKVSKLRAALIMRMAEQGITDGAQAFVEGILQDLETSWNVNIGGDDQGSGQVALESP
ncbi:probable histone H2A deubiquitinase MYSM1 at C-terminar half [Coccomyxa sp. Obi]|nr:probable histone H2A deubiquitinase MYSM1 at C-terminar half [Coccomyxa sp. Obi]